MDRGHCPAAGRRKFVHGRPAAAPATMNVGTYNIWCGVHDDGPLPWKVRCQRIAALIRFHDYDIIGMQEVRPEQMADLAYGAARVHRRRHGPRRNQPGRALAGILPDRPFRAARQRHLLAVGNPRKGFTRLGCRLQPHLFVGQTRDRQSKKSSSISTRTSTTWALWHATRAQS